MGDVLTFTPRQQPSEPTGPEPLSDAALRAGIEAGAQAALDMADRLIALLDRLDGDPDAEDGGDAEPSLAAPEGHASQVTWLRGGDDDHEAGTPEPTLTEVVVEPASLPWHGAGNVVAAAGVAILDLVAGGACGRIDADALFKFSRMSWLSMRSKYCDIVRSHVEISDAALRRMRARADTQYIVSMYAKNENERLVNLICVVFE